MGDIIKLSVVLLIIASVAGFAIALTYEQTKEKIEEQERMKEQKSLSAIFPEGTTISEQKGISSLPDFWIGKKEDTLIGYAFKGFGKGYSGDIKFIVGINPKGVILGLIVLEQTETPGLGTRVQEVVSSKYIWNAFGSEAEEEAAPWFTEQFKNIDVTKTITIDKAGEWHKLPETQREKLLKDNKITALTGATISTDAVKSGVKKYAYNYLSALKKEKE